MSATDLLGRLRPAVRRVFPGRYKETYINSALARFAGPTYVEIGVRDGESFRLAIARRKVGIDPLRTPAMQALRQGEEFFEMPSDDFFGGPAPTVLPLRSVEVALIDGLHEFRQVVRDLVNLAAYMAPNGIVFLDDFNPSTRERAADQPKGKIWNGDVWKLAPLIRGMESEWRIWTIDADEGIGVVAGFGEKTEVPPGLTNECKALDYDALDRDRASMLNLVSPAQFDDILEDVTGVRQPTNR